MGQQETKIPTAEELLDKKYPEFEHLDNGNIWVNVENLMIEFAKIHVEAALKVASETKLDGSYDGTRLDEKRYPNDSQEILNAYSLKNIK